jgi:hypothetical protein
VYYVQLALHLNDTKARRRDAVPGLVRGRACGQFARAPRTSIASTSTARTDHAIVRTQFPATSRRHAAAS